MSAEGYIVGIDIGGTKIRGILWNGKKILASVQMPTSKDLKTLKKVLGGILKKLERGKPRKIGIGVAGVINGAKWKLSPNIPYIKNLDFKKMIDREIKLDNDARCFARAELINSAAGKLSKNKKPVLFLTIGTGIGRALRVNKKILKIKKFEYPERWEKKYQKIRDSKSNRALAKFLGARLLKLTAPYNPDVLVIGGGVANRKGLLKLLEKEFKMLKSNIHIAKSSLNNASAAIGAALLFLKFP